MKDAPPRSIQIALEQLENIDHIKITGPFRQSQTGTWYLPFSVDLDSSLNPDIGLSTAWYAVCEAEYPHGDISIYPSKTGGVAKTFPHMQYNADLPQIRWWRTGKLCLDNPGFNLGRNKWQHEASTQEDRLKWHLEKTVQWVQAAANNTLLLPTDPLELPPFFRSHTTRVLGYHENNDSFQFWNSCDQMFGYASISQIDNSVSIIQEFQDNRKNTLLNLPWSPTFSKNRVTDEALWFRLPYLPILKPWHFPSRWSELIEVTTTDNGQKPLLDFLLFHAKEYRKVKRHPYLLIGFPISDTLQSNPVRIHWIAISNLKYVQKGTVIPGYTPTEQNWIRQDRNNFTSAQKDINWLPAENWTSDQIKTRVLPSENLTNSKILIIGCGALGSTIAEILVRSGVTKITLMDDDRLAMGNICRHTLDMRSIGRYKSDELVSKLNLIAPDVTAKSINEDFPSLKENTNILIREHDVIIDCTAKDNTLQSFSDFDWQGEKAFISLSLTWKLNGLLAYCASETSFPVIDAIERFRTLEVPDTDLEDISIREGLGCWNPIMPGEVENIYLAASVAVKFIKEAVNERKRDFKFFEFDDDGTVKRK